MNFEGKKSEIYLTFNIHPWLWWPTFTTLCAPKNVFKSHSLGSPGSCVQIFSSVSWKMWLLRWQRKVTHKKETKLGILFLFCPATPCNGHRSYFYYYHNCFIPSLTIFGPSPKTPISPRIWKHIEYAVFSWFLNKIPTFEFWHNVSI